MAERYGTDDSDPSTPPSAADVTVFVVLEDESGEALACGALRAIDAEHGELKRMFVDPAHRGRGASRIVLAALEQKARDLGWTRLVLETGTRQHEAVGLYESSGYAAIEPFGPYVGSAWSLCYAKEL
ncbi:GNAT family N-acetyltransferase [Aeromicrobium sp. IC_218]|nr:GNAT family N-acetyltransferase [Aeromicrobium sp. IC_218]